MRKVIENKQKAQTQRESGDSVFPSEEILGSMETVREFGAFYDKHKIDLEVAEAHFLLDYCNSMTFTPQELKAYRMGLNVLVKVFENANIDTNSYLLQAKEKQNRSVG